MRGAKIYSFFLKKSPKMSARARTFAKEYKCETWMIFLRVTSFYRGLKCARASHSFRRKAHNVYIKRGWTAMLRHRSGLFAFYWFAKRNARRARGEMWFFSRI